MLLRRLCGRGSYQMFLEGTLNELGLQAIRICRHRTDPTWVGCKKPTPASVSALLLTCCWPCSSPSAHSGVRASPPAPFWPSPSTPPLWPWTPSLSRRPRQIINMEKCSAARCCSAHTHDRRKMWREVCYRKEAKREENLFRF